MTEGTYVVSCMGVIDDGARARISLEFPADGWTGGGLAPGPGIVTREVGELATGRRHGMARAPIFAVRDGSAGCRTVSRCSSRGPQESG